MNIRIGFSGWKYDGWRRPFYHKKLSQKKELFFASREVNTIEINGSFYSLQRPTSYQTWYNETPSTFIFSVKGPRFITHMRRLVDVEAPLANFFASGVLALKEKLGPILWQLPPNFKFDKIKCEEFFKLLPRDTKEAARLGQKYDAHLKYKPFLQIDKNRKLLYAIEVRHLSFVDPEFVALLRKYRVALVFAKAKKEWPYLEEVTSDFIYARLHGEKEIYSSGYDKKTLDRWAKRFRIWAAGKEPSDTIKITKTPLKAKKRSLFVYFDNDVKVRAPFDAISLLERLTDFKPEVPIKKPDLKKLKIIYGPRVTG